MQAKQHVKRADHRDVADGEWAERRGGCAGRWMGGGRRMVRGEAQQTSGRVGGEVGGGGGRWGGGGGEREGHTGAEEAAHNLTPDAISNHLINKLL